MEVCIIIKYKRVKQNPSMHFFSQYIPYDFFVTPTVVIIIFDIAIYRLLVNYIFTIIFICEKWGTKLTMNDTKFIVDVI